MTDNILNFPQADATNNDLDKIALKKDAQADDKGKIIVLARLTPVEYDRVRKGAAEELGCRADTLDSLVKAQRRNREPKPAPAVNIDELAKSAADIIGCENIPDRFASEFRKVVAGEEKNGKLLYLIGTARLLPKPMHAAIKGTSAGGKSETRRQLLEFFPPESVVSFTSLSEKFLIYYEGDFAHKILSMGEAVATDEQDFQDYLLRELMSEGRIRHHTVQKIGNEIVTVTIDKEGPVSFMVTTTKNTLHPENETRMLSLEINDSEKQTKAVLRKVANIEGLNQANGQINYEPWRDFQRWLEAGERRVVVPFAPAMVELIPPASVRLRRDVGQVIRAIKAHALLHREHRAREDGQIVADIEHDYAAVRDLMNDILAENAGIAVKASTIETVDAVKEATARMSKEEGATAQAIGKILRLDRSAARRRLVGAVTEGFIRNLEIRKGQPGRYRATGQSVEHAVMLPLVPGLLQKHMPPCHRTEKAQSGHKDNGGKPSLPPQEPSQPPPPPVATGADRWQEPFATDFSLSSNELTPPVARWREICDPSGGGDADDLTTSDSLRCVQCNAGGDGLAPHRHGGRLVWLHPECVRFWKETPTYD